MVPQPLKIAGIVLAFVAAACSPSSREEAHVKALLELVRRHRAGERRRNLLGLLRASAGDSRRARARARRGRLALIEATSNQVNQEGGYTGLRPAQFRDLVLGLADQSRPAARAGRARRGSSGSQLLAVAAGARRRSSARRSWSSEYVRAGFRKIHLDCSMSCGDDPRALSDEIIAERTAALCAHAEAGLARAAAVSRRCT